eukprot:gnl/Carplike_NY0171/1555_a2109_748.p1 GENE.gnl/Carplike_NY0171/1555_a2109_748~~gnl/Carplike_NY0171/1555_a2109_748.p1  ORF type:complete len:410 (+),score=68.53 gnl/Carplike_NY0171/1555_a2109_748:68-1297(+)
MMHAEKDSSQRIFPEIDPYKYHVIQQIGKGAFSRVYLGMTPGGEKVAIKRLRLTSKPSSIEREIRLLYKFLDKANIVQLKDIIIDLSSYQTTVVTSFCESDDFKACLRLYSPLDIYHYIKSLLIALKECEYQKIIHRDVKPGNFLFSRKSRTGLLIDFGLAQSLEDARNFHLIRVRSEKPGPAYMKRGDGRPSRLSQPNPSRVRPREIPVEACGVPDIVSTLSLRSPLLPAQPRSGTHGYRAPEVLIPVRIQDTKIDVWCVGVILLCFLVGRGSLFRGIETGDAYEIMAIRAFIGTDAFLKGCAELGADILQTGTDVPMPSSEHAMGKSIASLRYACDELNPGLKGLIPDEMYQLCLDCLAFSPDKRPFASEALEAPLFKLELEKLPDCRNANELQVDEVTQHITQTHK